MISILVYLLYNNMDSNNFLDFYNMLNFDLILEALLQHRPLPDVPSSTG